MGGNIFLLSGAVIRSARFFLVGYLIKINGKSIQVFIEKYLSLEILSLVGIALLFNSATERS